MKKLKLKSIGLFLAGFFLCLTIVAALIFFIVHSAKVKDKQIAAEQTELISNAIDAEVKEETPSSAFARNVYGLQISSRTDEFAVKEMIEKCDEGFDISTTASMAESTFRESDCLEELVVKLMSTFTTQKEHITLQQLASIRRGYAGAMSSLFNNYVECSPGCGSMWSGMGTSYYNTLLREMALEIIQHHESY